MPRPFNEPVSGLDMWDKKQLIDVVSKGVNSHIMKNCKDKSLPTIIAEVKELREALQSEYAEMLNKFTNLSGFPPKKDKDGKEVPF